MKLQFVKLMGEVSCNGGEDLVGDSEYGMDAVDDLRDGGFLLASDCFLSLAGFAQLISTLVPFISVSAN